MQAAPFPPVSARTSGFAKDAQRANAVPERPRAAAEASRQERSEHQLRLVVGAGTRSAALHRKHDGPDAERKTKRAGDEPLGI